MESAWRTRGKSSLIEAIEASSRLRLALNNVQARFDRAIQAVGGKPESGRWDGWSLSDLEDAAAMAEHLHQEYGARMVISPKRGKGGRPTKLGTDVLARLIELLDSGFTTSRIAESLGVDDQTVKNWIRRENLKD